MKQNFLHFAITTTLLLLTTTTTTNAVFRRPVLDVNGEPLDNGKTYYLLPAPRNSASSGGFTYSPFAEQNTKCPELFFATQVQDNHNLGTPLSISNRWGSTVLLNREVLIHFRDGQDYHVCNKSYSSIWTMAPHGSNHVVVLDLVTWFKVVRDRRGGYNIRFCYGQDNVCGALGLVHDVFGKVALGYNVTGRPMSFVFQPSPLPNNKSFLKEGLIKEVV